MTKTPAVEERASRPRGGLQQVLLPGDSFQLDYREVIAAFGTVKSIRWAVWETYPYYEVFTDEKTVNLDASVREGFREFRLDEEMIRQSVREAYGLEAVFSVELIREYDTDYFALPRKNLPLPVYRVILQDGLNTRYYYNPETLSRQQVDDNSRLRRFLYRGLHSLHIKFLTDRPVLWNIVMYTLLIGGTFLSLTGVVLSFRWWLRKIRKLFRIQIRSKNL
ncbi:MAG: hypothetical protein LUD68_05625 [Rikenellaceae bacterium]|nr:hypothetical protein [Rikenellaceae bacterium]